MADIKGKFITLAVSLMKSKPEARAESIKAVTEMTGRSPDALDPEGWYDTRVLEAAFKAIEASSSPLLAWAALKVIGQNVYPTIEASVGLPGHLKVPLDFVRFEAEGFLANHRGSDVKPRRFVKTEEGHVIVEAPSPGYNCAFIEGVFDGILIMCHIRDGIVRQTKCIRKGHNTCEYEIKW
jgi:predicted hydrocarbon binding protein